jgi:hypothetical protein
MIPVKTCWKWKQFCPFQWWNRSPAEPFKSRCFFVAQHWEHFLRADLLIVPQFTTIGIMGHICPNHAAPGPDGGNHDLNHGHGHDRSHHKSASGIQVRHSDNRNHGHSHKDDHNTPLLLPTHSPIERETGGALHQLIKA